MSIGDAISLVALIIAFVSLYRSRKQGEMEKRMNELTVKLQEIQLGSLLKEEELKNSADIFVYYYLDGNGGHRLAIKNGGSVSAKNLKFEEVIEENSESIFAGNELEDNFPIAKLMPDHEIYLHLNIHLNSSSRIIAKATWENPDGSSKEKEIAVDLPV